MLSEIFVWKMIFMNILIIVLLNILQGFCYKPKLAIPSPPGSSLSDDWNKIVNGTRVQRRSRYPAQTLVYYKGSFRCGGTIIDQNHVLTSAHCVANDIDQRRGKFLIGVGKFKLQSNIGTEQFRRISKVFVPEEYKGVSYFHDIAILRFKKPLVFSRTVKPANLSTTDYDQTVTSSSSCYATGFGVVRDSMSYSQMLANVLQEINTNIISRKRCTKLADKLFGQGSKIYGGSVCTLDKNAGVCNGDSGGPVGCFDSDGTFYQVGVLSWGSPLCTTGFNVFMRVSYYRKWIESIIKR